MLLADEPDTEAWTLPTDLAWSGGTYLDSHGEKNKHTNKCMKAKELGCNNPINNIIQHNINK